MFTKVFVWNVVIIFVVTFLLLEGSFRLYHHISPVFIFPDNSHNRFRNKPFDYDYDDFRLNSRGFKDIEPQATKPQGSIRIAGIGDSFVYGVVPYKDNFLTLLEEQLNSIKSARYEVLNMGIPWTSPREYYSMLVKEALPLNAFLWGTILLKYHARPRTNPLSSRLGNISWIHFVMSKLEMFIALRRKINMMTTRPHFPTLTFWR